MREIDLFVEMIDEKEADRIITYFKEQPPGTRNTTASFEQKKVHIKRMFKSMTPGMIKKRRQGGGDPFYSYINTYQFPYGRAENYNEQLILINENKDDSPPFYRFANLLLTFPVET